MAERIETPFPMLRVQYDLLGGTRRMAALLLGTGAALFILIVAVRRIFQDDPLPSVTGGLLFFFTCVQGLIAVLGGYYAVYRAILRDYESKMNESHRLTPMSSFGVVLGYIFGPTLQVSALFLLVAFVGAVLSVVAQVGVRPWLYGNLLLLHAALTCWAAVTFFCLRPAKPFNPGAVLIGIALLVALIMMIPAAGFLLNVYPVVVAVVVMVGAITVPPAAIAMVVMVTTVYFLFWFLASCARYRRPDLPALNGVRGLVLLTWTMLVGSVGIVAAAHARLRPLMSSVEADDAEVQWMATMILGLLLGAAAISGAVQCRRLRERGTLLRGRSDRISPLFVAVAAPLLICVSMGLICRDMWMKFLDISRPLPIVWLETVAVCLVASLGLWAVFEFRYRVLKSPKLVLALVFIFVWAGVPMAESFRAEMAGLYMARPTYSWLIGCSPVGALVAIWSDLGVNIWPGVIVQTAMIVGLLVAIRMTSQSRVPPAHNPRHATANGNG